MSHRYETRSSKRSLRTAKKQPDPTHYLGYVEDFETDEMIMKKFEELDKLQRMREEQTRKEEEEKEQKIEEEQDNNDKNKNNSKDEKIIKSSKCEVSDEEMTDNNNNNNNNIKKKPVLTEEDLANLFRQTSSYTVQSVLKGNTVFYPKPVTDCLDDETDEDLVQGVQQAADYNMSDTDDYGELSETEFFNSAKTQANTNVNVNINDQGQHTNNNNNNNNNGNNSNNRETIKHSRQQRGKQQTKKASKNKLEIGNNRSSSSSAAGTTFLVKYDDKSGLASTKIGQRDIVTNRKIRNCSDENYIRVPPGPLPPSWAHTIIEDFDHDKKNKILCGSHYIETDILQMKKEELPHTDYLAILVDAPFLLKNQDSEGNLDINDFAKLELGKLMSNGILFIWTPSELIISVTEIVEKWGFQFVEHATWVKQNVNNTFKVNKGMFFNICKCNLLLFRKCNSKGKYGKLELRHQRTSDVYFDPIKIDINTKRFLKANSYAYDLIETLLPNTTKKCLADNTSTMLFLWAPKHEYRQGWTMVFDTTNRFACVP